MGHAQPAPLAGEAFAPDLSGIRAAQLEAMHDAAATVLTCERVLAKSGSSVVAEVLRGQGDFLIWERYPLGDVEDGAAHYFYHAHTPDEMIAGENGHFHLFVRPATVAPRLKPWNLPGAVVPGNEADRFVHIGGISVDGAGRPLRLFTTNRWVTNETLYRARDVIALLDRFVIELAHPNWAVNQWLNAMVVLYRPQLEDLLQRRDEALEAWVANNPGAEVLEDRRLQVTSQAPIDTHAQIAAIEAALGL